jgi:hypothetical protein
MSAMLHLFPPVYASSTASSNITTAEALHKCTTAYVLPKLGQGWRICLK